MSIIGFTPWGVPIAGGPAMPWTMNPERVSEILGGQLGMGGGLPITLTDMQTVVVAGVDGTSVELSPTRVGDRKQRLRSNVKEPLFHQTNLEACRLIIESATMKRGSSGIAGGGIYFASSLQETMHKAHQHGFVLQCRVQLGRVQKWPAHKIDTHATFRSLLQTGHDSVFIPRCGGDEHIVYNQDQVTLLRVCRSKSDGKQPPSHVAGPWFEVNGLRADLALLSGFLDSTIVYPPAKRGLGQMPDHEAPKPDISWCTKGAFAKQGSKVGEVTMDPDSDDEVKIRWSDGTQSGYIKAAALTKAAIDEQKSAASWCKEGIGGKHEGKIGTLTMSPDSDAEVKLKWADGSESGYLKAVRVHPLSSSEEVDLQFLSSQVQFMSSQVQSMLSQVQSGSSVDDD